MSDAPTVPAPLRSATRALDPKLLALLQNLKSGQRIRITQTVRVGSSAKWTTTIDGMFRNVNYLATGLATDRVPEDDIVVIAVHFIKDNGELSSVTLDENTRIELLNG
jgi:azurin